MSSQESTIIKGDKIYYVVKSDENWITIAKKFAKEDTPADIYASYLQNKNKNRALRAGVFIEL